MTTIRYTEHEDIIKISLDGHAEFNPGNDPVCAALSTITYQMLNVLDSYHHRGIISMFSADVRPGYTMVSFTTNDKAQWDMAWEIIRIGYENIAAAYPNNVFIE